MKKLIAFALMTLFVTGAAWSAEPAQRPFAPVQGGFTTDAADVDLWAPDRVMVQFTKEAFVRAELRDETGKASASLKRTGLASLDVVLDEIQTRALRPAFRQPAQKSAASALGLDRWYMVELDGWMDAKTAQARLAIDPNLAAVELDYAVFPDAVPNDPLYPNNWGHNNTAQLPGGAFHNLPPVGTPGFDSNAQAAWSGTQGYGNTGVVIAIIDSGVDPTHPDLVQVTGYDFGDNDTDPSDDSAEAGHGTACAGVAAAIANNSTGVAGIAGGCSIMPLKVANSSGSMFLSAVANAITWAADHGADVISMSLGSALTTHIPTDGAATYAYNAGVTMMASTGNENASQIGYPAYNPLVIGVGAASPCGDRKRSSSSAAQVSPGVNTDPNGTTCDGEYFWGSNYGSTIQNHQGAVDVIAPTILPTTDIQGTGGYSFNSYSSYFNGTSCSSPYAAGVAALIKAVNPGFSPNEVRTQLVGTAQDIVNIESVEGWDRYTGYGMVDAAAAVGNIIEPPVVAEFSADHTEGCAPFTVNFTDESVGSITGWNWDFGDGLQSLAQNPSHTYSAPGTYDVALTVSGPDGSDLMTKYSYIVVGDVPAADFSSSVAIPDVATAGVPIDFTDLSTGMPTSWLWDFGDGGSSTAQNPSYAYSVGGVYSVSLTATNSCGEDTELKSNLIYVTGSVAPTADFSLDPGAGCAPLEVTFTDLSTGSPTSWAWDFGDGGSSTLQNPVYTYTAAGTYDVTLTATSAGGSDAHTVVGAVVVTGAPVASYDVSDTVGAGPMDVTFTDTSTGNPTAWAWDFGDGGTSTVQNPMHTFTTEGFFTVQLIATSACGADTATVVNAVHVEYLSPVAGQVPVVFGLGRNYPNPFNPSTTIVFNLEKPGHARLEVFDVSGRRVAQLVDSDRAAGRHEFTWRPDDLASGIYFARLSSGDLVDTKRITLLK